MSSQGFAGEVTPAYFTLRVDPVGYQPSRDVLFGTLEAKLVLRSALHVGTGAPRVVQMAEGGEEIVEGMVVRPGPKGPQAVVPGSSVKGAVRSVFEALTRSCPVTTNACRFDKRGRSGELCAACTSFGTRGSRGRVGFDDVVFGVEPTQVITFAQRYQGKSRDPNLRRFYGPRPERSQASDQESVLCVGEGSEATLRVRLGGVDVPCAGAIVAVLGLVPDTMPHLRLGGGKNRGLGIVELSEPSGKVADSAVGVALGQTRQVGDEELGAWFREAREKFGPGFDDTLAELRHGYGVAS